MEKIVLKNSNSLTYRIGELSLTLEDFIMNHQDFHNISRLTFNKEYFIYIKEDKLSMEDLELSFEELLKKYNKDSNSNTINITIKKDISEIHSYFLFIFGAYSNKSVESFQTPVALEKIQTKLAENPSFPDKLNQKLLSLVENIDLADKVLEAFLQKYYNKEDTTISYNKVLTDIKKDLKSYFGINSKIDDQLIFSKTPSSINKENDCSLNSYVYAYYIIDISLKVIEYSSLFLQKENLKQVIDSALSNINPLITKLVLMQLKRVFPYLYKYGISLFDKKEVINIMYNEKVKVQNAVMKKIISYIKKFISIETILGKEVLEEALDALNFENINKDLVPGFYIKQSYINEEPPKIINISEKVWLEINNLIKAQLHFTHTEHSYYGTSNEEREKIFFQTAFLRNLKIFEIYGVVFEDILEGHMLFNI